MYRRRDHRQHLCPYLGCGLAFGLAGELADHLRDGHRGAAADYLCRRCYLVFRSKTAYLKHVSEAGRCDHGARGYASCGVVDCGFWGTYASLEAHTVCVHGAPSTDSPESAAEIELTCSACCRKFSVLITFLAHLANECCATSTRRAEVRTSCAMDKVKTTSTKEDEGAGFRDPQGHEARRTADELVDSTARMSLQAVEMRFEGVDSLQGASCTTDNPMDTAPDRLGSTGGAATYPASVSSAPRDDGPMPLDRTKSLQTSAKKTYGFNVLFRCALCRDRFDVPAELSFHVELKHKGDHRGSSAIQQWDPSAGQYQLRRWCTTTPTDHEYSCLLCGRFSTSNRKDLVPHMMTVHGRHCCLECGRIFAAKNGLNIHLGSLHHKYKCYVASRSAAVRQSATDGAGVTGGSKARVESPATDTLGGTGQAAGGTREIGEAEVSSTAAKKTGAHQCSDPTLDKSRHDCCSCARHFSDPRAMQRHAFKTHGIYSCGYCSWATTDGVERLRLHHYEQHESLSFLNPASSRPANQSAPRSSTAGIKSVSVDAASGSPTEAVAFQVEKIPVANGNVASNRVLLSKVWTFKCHVCEAEVEDMLSHLYREHGLRACPDCVYCGRTERELQVHRNSEHGGTPPSTDDPSFVEATEGRRTSNSRNSDRSVDSEPDVSDVDDADFDEPCFIVSDEMSRSSCEQTPRSGSESTASDVSWSDDSQDSFRTSSSVSHSDRSNSDDEEAVELGEGEEKKRRNSLSCDKCSLSFTSKVILVCHMVKAHQQHGFCAYCKCSTAMTAMMELHQRRMHHGYPLRYLALQGGSVLTLVADASKQSAERELPERTSSCFDFTERDLRLGRSLLKNIPTRGRRAVFRNGSSLAQRYLSTRKHALGKLSTSSHTKCHNKSRKEGERRRVFTLSSSDEMDAAGTSEGKDEEGPAAIKTYSGYRVPKSAAAFGEQLEKVGRRFHCCMFSCSFSTDSQSVFAVHLDGHTEPGRQLFCIYCGEVSSSSEALLSHLDQKHWTLQHQCPLCFYRASSKLYVQCHFELAHRHAEFSSLEVLADEPHSPRLPPSLAQSAHRPYRCGFRDCHFSVRDTPTFFEHLAQSHRAAASFPCSECDQGSDSAAQLVDHLTEHGLCAVQCGYCPASATTLSVILLHLCHCHADVDPKFHVRDQNLGKKFREGNSALKVSRDAFAEDSGCVELQQRCYCCSSMLTGFGKLRAHLELKHRLSPTPREIADHLFASYDYAAAVRKGRCPFCSLVAKDSATLREHVLYQELRCADIRSQPSEGDKNGDEDDCQLWVWAEANLCFQRHQYVCPECPETFDDGPSGLALHLHRHYTYYPVACKLCDVTLRGFVARDRHLSQEHGATSSGTPLLDVSLAVREVLREQDAGPEWHGCRKCDFESPSSSYIEEHRLRCNGSFEKEATAPFKCGVCTAAFHFLQPLFEHGLEQHCLACFCADCYFGASDKATLRQSGHPCRGRDAFLVEHRKRCPKRHAGRSTLYVRQVAVLEDCDIYYRRRDFQFHGLDRLFLQLSGLKVPVVDVLAVSNFEPFVRVRDINVHPAEFPMQP